MDRVAEPFRYRGPLNMVECAGSPGTAQHVKNERPAMLSLPFLLADFDDETGLVAIGGDLRPERLLQAYRCGIFPWYDEEEPICWWSPDPRAIFELDGLHVSRRL